MKGRRKAFCLLILVITIAACSERTITLSQKDVAIAWAQMSLYVTKNTPSNSPTYASRCFGYIGLTMYEAVRASDENYNSVAGQLNGLGVLPSPEKGQKYNWVLSANAAQASILRNLYNQTSRANKSKIDSLENLILNIFSEGESDETISRSVAFGKIIAEEIFDWSQSDGGHRGYLANFDKKLKMPTEKGCWEPPLYGQSFSHYPLHPYWGRNRTFLTANAQLETPEYIRYDSVTNSEYGKLFQQVYEKQKVLTQTEKEIALWWGDDPGDTFTPPGHSYYLATCALKKSNVTLVQCAEAYARVGMAVADAFINCWKWKYIYSSERPSSYISKRIDNHFEAFWPDPPFPAFPSGHATQAGAVAEVLTDIFGPAFEFTDDAHAGRPKDEIRNVEFKSRTYNSFWAAAEETAMSRFYGGIHTAQDNDIGLREGKKMGTNINNLAWRKRTVLANY